MGLRARKIHALSLLILLAAMFCSGAFLLAQDLSSGSHTVVKRYILPRYSNSGKLQCVIYGTQAINEGSLIRLAFTPHQESGRSDDDKVAVMIDFVDGSSYSSISQIDTVKPNQVYPSPYKLGAKERNIQEWWRRSRHKHSQAWIFIEKTKLNAAEEPVSESSVTKSSDSAVVVAVFDKSTNILTSDETAFFRSRQLDADGVGFDAFSDRKFIHIRSNVRAILHIKDDKKQTEEEPLPEEDEQGLGSLFSSDSPADVRADSADIDLENNIVTLIGNVVVDDHKNKITCDKMVITLEDDAADTLIGSAEKPEDAPEEEKPEETPEDKDDDDEDEDTGSIRKIVCIGNVVCTMRDGSDGQGKEQIALCEQAEYDVAKRIVVMTGAHSAPADVLPENVYGVMERQVRKAFLAKSPVMMQDEDWMVGESFTIFIKEKNRLKVDDIKVNYTGSIMSMKDEDKDSAKEKADDGEEKTATLISADSADINIEQNFILLRGNVDIDDQSTKITCQEMEIRLNGDEKATASADAKKEADEQEENLFGNKSVSKVICKNDVVYMERPKADDPDGENRIAMSDRAVYDAVKETILMTGSPVVMQGTNKMHGETIEILSKEDNRVIVSAVKAYLAGKLLSSDEEDASGVGSTTITASTADFRPDEKITLSKNVVIDDGSGRITCSEMDIFLQKDASNSFFTAGKQPQKDNTEDGDELKNDVSKIVCSGNVVYRRKAEGQEQVVLARKADYDAVNEVIVMSGAHTAPQGEVSDETYAEIKRALSEKTTASGASVFEQYSILMQGDNWIAGNPITIHPKEGNRLKATDMKAALRRSSRSKTASGEGN
jgi:lipopolysaccharide export system protein LptA